MTKTFTAALILTARGGRRRLGLDDPVVRWLPEYAGDASSGRPRRSGGRSPSGCSSRRPAGCTTTSQPARSTRSSAPKKRGPGRPRRVHPVREEAVVLARRRLGVLEHELPAPRARRRAGRPGRSTRSSPHARSSIRRARVALRPGRREDQGAVAKGYDFTTLSRTAKPIGWSDGTKIMPFTAVTSAAGAAGRSPVPRATSRGGASHCTGEGPLAGTLATMLAFDGTAGPGAASDYGLGVGRRLVGSGSPWAKRHGSPGSARSAGCPSSGVIAVLTNQDRWDPDRVVSRSSTRSPRPAGAQPVAERIAGGDPEPDGLAERGRHAAPGRLLPACGDAADAVGRGSRGLTRPRAADATTAVRAGRRSSACSARCRTASRPGSGRWRRPRARSRR